MRWLTRFIDAVRVIDLEPGGQRQVDRLPDGHTTIVIRTFGPNEGDVWVFGPRSRAHFKTVSGFVRTIAVQIKPGWVAPLLGVAAAALTDQFVPLHDIVGDCDALCDKLVAAGAVDDVLDILSFALESRFSAEPSSSLLARRAVRLFETELRVDSVAKQLGVTSRHLRRAFLEAVGIGPKEFARGVRLQRAIRRTTTGLDWSRIATDVGYYDQSHLIADFRDLVGLTPRAYLARLHATTNAVPTT